MTALATTVLADSWGWHHGDVGIGWWIVMMLGMVIFWGAIVALVVWLVRGGSTPRAEPPQQILRRRLADGSISVEDYEQRRAALESSTSTSKDDAPRAGPAAGPSTPSPSPST
jgi:putative membrane protein